MTPFLEACEAGGPLQFGVTSPGGQENLTQVWHRPFVIIGRDLHADIPLQDPRVSRRHVYIQIIEGRAFCVDLGSRTGIHWGSASDSQGWLDKDQFLNLGDSRIRLAAGYNLDSRRGGNESPMVSEDEESINLPYVTLEFTNGTTDQAHWPMYSALAIVGRASGCKVRLQSPTISRYHCSLVRTPYGVWVVDLQGREGVRVNNQRVRYAKLEDGDFLQVGRFRIRLHCGPPPRTWEPEAPRGAAPRHAPPGTLMLRPTATDLPARSLEGAPTTALTQAGVEAVQSIVAPLMNEFASMQQHMFEQFQQSMFMLVQMMRSSNQEQMQEIRGELEEIRSLTHELRDLQKQLHETRTAADLSQPPGNVAEVVFAPLPTAEEGQVDLLLSALTMIEPTAAPPNIVVDPTLKEPQIAAPKTPQAKTPRAAIKEEPAPAAAQADPKPAPAAPDNGAQAPKPAAQEPPAKPKPAAMPEGMDLHDWLTRRLATIQKDRQTRMQKILGLIKGKF